MAAMSDIVERLRRWTHAVDAAPASDLMDEAAAEIERLRLTDAEREAVIVALIELRALSMSETNHSDALRSILARLP